MRLFSKFLVLFVALSVCVALGLPAETVKEYTFDLNFEGWVPMDVSDLDPSVEAPLFGANSGKLSIDSNGVQTTPGNVTYGFWMNDLNDITGVDIPDNSLFRATFYVSTDQADHQRVPLMRLGLANETSNLISLYQVASVNNASVINTPTAATQPFEAYFQPHDGTLSAFNGLLTTFELANGLTGSDDGALFMDRVVIDRFDLSSVTFSNTQAFNLDNWIADTSVNVAGGYWTCDFLRPAPGVIGLQPYDKGSAEQNTNCFGLWTGYADQLSIDGTAGGGGSFLYRATFSMHSYVDNSKDTPAIFLGLFQANNREGAGLGVTSNIDIGTAPYWTEKNYSLYFRPPNVEVTTAPVIQRQVYCEFQMRNFYLDSQKKKREQTEK
jgi:hypothetical protein